MENNSGGGLNNTNCLINNPDILSHTINDNVTDRPLIDDIYNHYWKKKPEFLKEYLVQPADLSNPKIEFRYFCFRYIDYIKLFDIPDIQKKLPLEAVLIEYRKFPHVEFIIRNSIQKLGVSWSYTIVCGTENYDYMVKLATSIHENINVVKTPYDNVTPSLYSTILASADFWNLVSGSKILIMQEDSIIFGNNISDFLQWDFIGAPWPKEQNDAPVLVGNGGFSLRSKQVMLDVISKLAIKDTLPNSSTLGYMNATNNTVLPEDVYFSKNMQEFGIGRVAPWNIAFKFSTETQYSPNSFAGHNFWLCDPNWKKRLYNFLFRFAHIRSPYGLHMGGGEKYLLDVGNYFINSKNCFLIIEVTDDKNIASKTIESVGLSSILYNSIIIDDGSKSPFDIKPKYYFNMENSLYPNRKPIGTVSIYHCQFPFDTQWHNNSLEGFLSYQHFIVNSDFTKNTCAKMLPLNTKIKIQYPCCIKSVDKTIYSKEANTFVLIGRLFNYNINAHNKNFDKVINAFNNSTNNTYSLHIIGACIHELWLNYLKSLSTKNVIFHINCTDEEKISVFRKTKYIINATGLDRNIDTEPYAYEHFGIGIIEGINNGCIPITVDGGYPAVYVRESNNPLIFKSKEDLSKLISDIGENDAKYKFEYNYYNRLLSSFNREQYFKSLDSILKENIEIKSRTTLYLLYSYENISNFSHPNIIPLKLDQTFYFESEAFRMLKEADLPKCENIGFITPKGLSIILKSKKKSLNEFMDSLNCEIKDITPLLPNKETMANTIKNHGNKFRLIWDYLALKMYNQNYDFYSLPIFIRNCWVAPYKTVVNYLAFAKSAISVLDNASPAIRKLLISNSYYPGKLKPADCLKKFGVPHYTFHPFIMERLICFYKYAFDGRKKVVVTKNPLQSRPKVNKTFIKALQKGLKRI